MNNLTSRKKCTKIRPQFSTTEWLDHKTLYFSGKAESAIISSDPKGVEYDRFNLEWTARSLSPVSSFKVEYKMMSEDIWKSMEADAFKLPHDDSTYAGTSMISKLNPATVYLARVSSRNAYGFSNPSQAFKFATRGAGRSQFQKAIFTKFS